MAAARDKEHETKAHRSPRQLRALKRRPGREREDQTTRSTRVERNGVDDQQQQPAAERSL
jgi:hypothetical protein